MVKLGLSAAGPWGPPEGLGFRDQGYHKLLTLPAEAMRSYACGRSQADQAPHPITKTREEDCIVPASLAA